MDFLLDLFHIKNISHMEHVQLICTIVSACTVPFIVMISFIISKRFIRLELNKLEDSASIFERIIIFASGILTSPLIVFLCVVVINTICRHFCGNTIKIISSNYLMLSIMFSMILTSTYALMLPHYSQLRIVKISDEDAFTICRKFMRIMIITFSIAAISSIFNYTLKHSPNRLVFEFFFSFTLVIYYFIEMVLARKYIGRIMLINKSKHFCESAKLASFINDKFIYLALVITAAVVTANFISSKKSMIIFFININHICLFLVSMFTLQAVITNLINKILGKLDIFEKNKMTAKLFLNRRDNLIWICNIVVMSVYLVMLSLFLKYIGLDFKKYIFQSKIMTVAWIAFITAIIYKVFNEFTASILEKSKTKDPDYHAKLLTFLPTVSVAFYTVLFIITGLITLSNLNIDVTPVVAVFSVFSVAVGLAAKDIIQSFLQGVTLLLERNLFIGDFVKINGMAGVIEKLSIRVLYLRDNNGNVHIIPYNIVSTITNCSKDYSCHIDSLQIGVTHDVEKVSRILKGIVQDMRNEEKYKEKILEDVVIHGVMPLDLTGLKICWEIKTTPDAVGEYIKCEIYRRLVDVFKKQGIDIPIVDNISISSSKSNL